MLVALQNGCSGKPICAAIADINLYFASAPNCIDMLKGIVGERSIVSVNHLMCSYRGSSTRKFFTSAYIARIALQEGGFEAVRLAYGIASGLQSPSFM
jgi:hypothetical protein